MLLAGCAGSGGSNSAASGAAASGTCQGESVKVAKPSPSFVYLPFYVAEGGGFFEEEGLVPETVEVHTGAGIVAAAVSGSVDVALVTAGEVFVAAEEGAPVQAFAQVSNMATNVVIKQRVLDELGLTTDSPDDAKLAALKGLRIGVTGSGSGTDQVIRYLATAGGLDPDKDMEIIATGGSGNSVSGFSGDRFDAIAISSPQSNIAIQQGSGAYLFNIANGDYEPLANNLYITGMASTRTIAQKTNVLECFTTALAHAQQVIENDPEKAAELAQPYMGDIDPAMYAEAFEANINAWPTTPAVDPDAAKAALNFQNQFLGGTISEEVLVDAINTDIASSATAE
ncbi:ABC transporter substrate-binding protein [Rhodococcus sp. 14C212]|uniref:ABC transporter substrate-binding protein n=1 Tax=Rhodococcus sp. 14C212 TaxID=2711209 RepID=UPI0013ECDAE7|nr:ABC transporter substrate-binding protein [Rhodococcus sp. 14C212]NGP07800.1 ABC transporter substrate-binding protein [Rhodococcus sp. 14C212]